MPLKSHVASDIKAKGIGDIEIIDRKSNSVFEDVEIKHGIPIDSSMVRDVYKKIKYKPIERYYILTTAEPNIKKGEDKKIFQLIDKIRKNHGCEIVANGLITSIKYYLRFVQNLNEFIIRYSKNIQYEASISTIIKLEHIKKWEEIAANIRLNKEK